MRPARLVSLPITALLVALAACTAASPAGSTQPGSSASAAASAAASAPASAGASVGMTTGPNGMPIGTWSLTLTGGPAAGTYGGSDEMICTGIANGPRAVTFQPVGSPPLQQVNADTIGSDSSILVSAGGIESGATYQAATNQFGQSAVLGQATITDGILTFAISGTQQFPGEPVPRTIDLSATCPLFPADTNG